jgi:hypothetical protein
LNGLDPQARHADFLRGINDHAPAKLHELLPWHWKKSPEVRALLAQGGQRLPHIFNIDRGIPIPDSISEFSTVAALLVTSRYVISARAILRSEENIAELLRWIKHFLDNRRSQAGSSSLVISIT